MRRKIEFFNRRCMPDPSNNNNNNEVVHHNRSSPENKFKSTCVSTTNDYQPRYHVFKHSVSSDASNQLPPPPAVCQQQQYHQPVDSSVAITDRLFEKFCVLVNEEIMGNQTAAQDNRDDVNAADETTTTTSERNDSAVRKFVANNSDKFKINSRLLNELLDAHANDQMSLSDPNQQQQQSKNNKSKKK